MCAPHIEISDQILICYSREANYSRD